MKNILRYLYVLIGSLLIAFSLNFILIPNNISSFGFAGIAGILYILDDVNVALNLFIFNVIFIILSLLFLNKKIVIPYILPSILIPISLYLFQIFLTKFSISFPETMLTIIAGGVVSGVGYSIIYKQGFSAGISFLLEELFGHVTHFHSKLYSWIIDIIVIVLTFMALDYQYALYSFIVIFITKYLITKARFGINDSKMFYIITSKEDEVKNFIIHDLKYELTVLDVKGGFSKKKKKILLSVISSEDYYKLKEGVKLIDEKAFIAITDTYDVVSRRSFK